MNHEIPELNNLTIEERGELTKKLIKEQVIEQRVNLHFWRKLTGQPAQIDTGYIGQHLVSIITGIKGGGFRGKGLDLEDGSEIKSANFLDSLDKNGSTSPRWNFTCNSVEEMESLLDYPSIYLVSIDLNPNESVRVRVWKLYPKKHDAFKKRYIEWMEKLGYPKLRNPKRQAVNFQLFPPRHKFSDTYARHGNGKENGFDKLEIKLEEETGSNLIYWSEIEENNIIVKFIKNC